jgi:hypothetical protein
MTVDQELSATLVRVAAAFETVAVPWAIGGFVSERGPLGEGQLVRRRLFALSDAGPNVFVLGPEDTISLALLEAALAAIRT